MWSFYFILTPCCSIAKELRQPWYSWFMSQCCSWFGKRLHCGWHLTALSHFPTSKRQRSPAMCCRWFSFYSEPARDRIQILFSMWNRRGIFLCVKSDFPYCQWTTVYYVGMQTWFSWLKRQKSQGDAFHSNNHVLTNNEWEQSTAQRDKRLFHY